MRRPSSLRTTSSLLLTTASMLSDPLYFWPGRMAPRAEFSAGWGGSSSDGDPPEHASSHMASVQSSMHSSVQSTMQSPIQSENQLSESRSSFLFSAGFWGPATGVDFRYSCTPEAEWDS